MKWKTRRRLWLRNLVIVKRELEQERFPRSVGEGLSQVEALSEIGLDLSGRGRRSPNLTPRA